MARKRDLTAAAQSATAALFGEQANPETKKTETKKASTSKLSSGIENTTYGKAQAEREKAAKEGRVVNVHVEEPKTKTETVTVRNIITKDPEPKKTTVSIPVTKITKETTTASSKLLLNLGDYREYVSIMAGLSGVSMTKYIQNLIRKDAEANAATYNMAKNLRKK